MVATKKEQGRENAVKNCCVFALPHVVTTPNASALASHEITLHPPCPLISGSGFINPGSLACSFIRSLAHSFTRLLIRSLAHSFVCTLAHSFARSFVRLLTLLTRSLICRLLAHNARSKARGKVGILMSPNQAVLHHSALPYFLFTPLFILPYL